ncbi:MAG: pyridoxamine 5'-phosphate oxidase family protein [Eubacteriales bacterium]
MNANSKVSFTVVGFEKVIPSKTTTHYESAIAFGNAQVVSDETQKIEKLKILCQKYGSGADVTDAAIAKYLHATAVVAIHIQKVTGKRNNG